MRKRTAQNSVEGREGESYCVFKKLVLSSWSTLTKPEGFWLGPSVTAPNAVFASFKLIPGAMHLMLAQ